jgi:hypothetical protein
MSINSIEQNNLTTVEVLSASDLNPKYLNCVKFYISSWLSIPIQNQTRFIPKVLIIANSIPEILKDYSDYLLLVDAGDLPSAYVSQAARIVEARNSRADFVMTSDIDMLPLSVRFESSIINSGDFSQDSFFILRDVLEPGQFPICYNLAKPSVWQSLFNQYEHQESTSNILWSILHEHGGPSAYSGMHGGKGWTIDQQTLWNLVQHCATKIQVESFVDNETAHRRLDRIHHKGLVKWVVLPLVFIGYYHDYHVHHPVDLNRTFIKVLLKIRNLGMGMRYS